VNAGKIGRVAVAEQMGDPVNPKEGGSGGPLRAVAIIPRSVE